MVRRGNRPIPKNRNGGVSNKIDMRVMQFSDLPHYCEREKWLDTLNKMYGKRGYLFHHKTPADWIDYLILIAAKPWVVRDAATRNKFKSKYFMWIDAGALNPMYAGFWDGWCDKIDAHPDRIRMTIAPTLGKPRPRFVPRFIYDLYQFITHTSAKYIPNATPDTLARQSLTDIAMINAEYDVPASSFMVPHDRANDFWAEFERARKIMLRHNLVSTEQAVFQTMMKFDVNNMFQVCYIRGYTGVYTAVAQGTADAVL